MKTLSMKTLSMKALCMALVGTGALVSCATQTLPQKTVPQPASRPLQLMEVQFDGVTSAHPTSRVRLLQPDSFISKQAPIAIASGLKFKSLGATSFTIDSTGKRYISAVFQITNNTGRDINDLGFVGVNLDDTDGNTANNAMPVTVGSTAFAKVKYYDGSDASSKATLLTPGALYTYDIINNEADVDPSGPVFDSAVVTTKLIPETPTGLSMNVLNFGWILDGSFPNGSSKNVTFSMSFDVSDDPAQNPFSFSLIAAYTEEPLDPFDITLDFSGDTLLTTSQKAIFEQAADRWEQAITTGLSSATYNGTPVDDVLISASAVTIDGVNGVLGQAGPTNLRGSNKLPIRGVMQFDTADLGNMETKGTLLKVIMHEMGHVLGLGTLWDSPYLNLMSYNQSSCSASTSIVFTGSNAITQYNLLGGVGSPPVENSGGTGTKCGHWSETTFQSELMTGYATGSMEMSRLTIGALKDMGYTVNLAAADSYILPSGLVQQQHAEEGHQLIEIPTIPSIDPRY